MQEEFGFKVDIMMTDFIPWLDGKREDEFVEAAYKRVLEAKSLGCRKLAYFTDDFVKTMSHQEQLERIENCAMRMLPFFEKEGCELLLEPINNKIDHKDCSLWDFYESVDMVRRVNSPSFRMLFDIYHMQIMHGDVTRKIIENKDIISHLHCAGNPDRCEIYKGELNYSNILNDVCEKGYEGTVGCEYFPTEDIFEGLKRTKQYLGV